MRLRHKKPINSYVGQAGHQSNDAQDEDFIRTSVSCKKNQILKPRSSNEEIRKYAQFLCQFVNSANKNYQNFQKKNQSADREPTFAKDNKEPKQLNLPTQRPRGGICDKSQEVVAKQQQKIQNTLKLINKHPILTKKIKKDKQELYELHKNTEFRTRNAIVRNSDPLKKAIPAPETIPNEQPQVQKKIETQPKPSNVQIPPPAALQPPMETPNLGYQIPNSVINEQIQNLLFLQQQLIQNPLYSSNPALYSMFPMPSYPPAFNFQACLEQLKYNSFMAMNNPMGIFQTNKFLPNAIPFSKLPHNMANDQKQPKPDQSVPKRDPTLTKVINPQQKVGNEGQKKLNENQGNQTIQFKSKSCYHIGIAYNIHFSKLKEKGDINFNDKLDIQKIDPTYPAKRARQRKASDGITNMQQQTH